MRRAPVTYPSICRPARHLRQTPEHLYGPDRPEKRGKPTPSVSQTGPAAAITTEITAGITTGIAPYRAAGRRPGVTAFGRLIHQLV